MTALIEFEWSRDSAGYHIETRQYPEIMREGIGLLALPPDTPTEYECVVPNGGPPEYYRPLDEEPSLFAILAATEPTPEGIKGFAEKYGFLAKAESVQPIDWVDYIEGMRSIVDALQDGNYQGIADAFNESGDDDLSIKFNFMHGRNRPVLHLAPQTLMAALWLQVAQHVSSDRELRMCLHCGTGFVFGSGTRRRRSGHYCSDRCRKLAWLASKEAKK